VMGEGPVCILDTCAEGCSPGACWQKEVPVIALVNGPDDVAFCVLDQIQHQG
jgi:hypothetical protein